MQSIAGAGGGTIVEFGHGRQKLSDPRQESDGDR
jgi:hypothetical protein